MPIIPQSVTDALVSVNKMFEGKQAQDAANAQALNDVDRVRDAKDIEGKRVGLKPPPADLIPVPPRADPWFGVRCEGAGVPGKRNSKCYRQAQMFRMAGTVGPDIDSREPLSIRQQEAQLKRRFAQVYGQEVSPQQMMSESYRHLDPIGAGQMVKEQPKIPVCLFHANVDQFDLPHPDDRPSDWATPVPEAPKPVKHTLDDLDLTAGLSVANMDANFVWLTDGKITVMASTLAVIDRFGLDWCKRVLLGNR